MSKPTYAKATQKVQRIFQRAQTRNTAQLPAGPAKVRAPKLSQGQLLAIATNGAWKP